MVDQQAVHERHLITLSQAAQRLALDVVVKRPEEAVIRMGRRGQIRLVRVTRFWMVDPESINRFIESTAKGAR